MKVAVVLEDRATPGECPLWCERTASLGWTDLEAAPR